MDIEIVVDEFGPDWIMVHANLSEFRKEVELERLPDLVSKSVIAWLRMHPELKVRATLPIVEGGSTVACHVWLERRELGG